MKIRAETSDDQATALAASRAAFGSGEEAGRVEVLVTLGPESGALTDKAGKMRYHMAFDGH